MKVEESNFKKFISIFKHDTMSQSENLLDFLNSVIAWNKYYNLCFSLRSSDHYVDQEFYGLAIPNDDK